MWGSLRLAPTSDTQGLFGASLSEIALYMYSGPLMGGELQQTPGYEVKAERALSEQAVA
jgi:hypothetical protein